MLEINDQPKSYKTMDDKGWRWFEDLRSDIIAKHLQVAGSMDTWAF